MSIKFIIDRFKQVIKNIFLRLLSFFFKDLHSNVIWYTFFAIVLFDFSIIIGDYNYAIYHKLYEDITINLFLPQFWDFVLISFIATVVCIIICSLLSRKVNDSYLTEKKLRIIKMFIIFFIMIIVGIIKLIKLGITDLSVIRLVFYLALPAEAGFIVYLDGFKYFKENIRNINKSKINNNDYFSLINFYYKEFNFYFDKIVMVVIFLGTIFGVAMTIMWIAPSLSPDKPIKSVYSIGICIGFFVIAMELFLWCFKPLWESKHNLIESLNSKVKNITELQNKN